MQDYYPLIFFAFASICLGAWTIGYPRYLLKKWAASNGYEILKIRMAFFWQYSFAFEWRKNKSVYRLKVKDERGKIRRCFVRVVNSRGRSLEEKIDVEWVDLA